MWGTVIIWVGILIIHQYQIIQTLKKKYKNWTCCLEQEEVQCNALFPTAGMLE